MFAARVSCGVPAINMPAVLIANGLGVCLMLVVIFNKYRHAKWASYDSRLFHWMCRICLTLCILETAGFLWDRKVFWGARQLCIVVNVITYLLSFALAYIWICYVDYRLFNDHVRLQKNYIWAMIPAGIVCLMAVANCFFPVFFGISKENVYYRTPLFLIPYVVIYGYLTYGAVLTYHYRNKVNRYLFMPVMLFLTPIYLGSLIQLIFYGIALIWVSVSVGLVFLYINLQHEESFLDSLTNLYNRNYLLYYMDYIMKRAQAGRKLIGIMLDINDFKKINDTYGHIAGDSVLRAVGEILVRSTDTSSIVVRYGGDEFVILVEGDRGKVEEFCSNIERELRDYNAANTAPLPVSLSAGIAEFDKVDVFKFFQEMDRNMYREKHTFYQQRDLEG